LAGFKKKFFLVIDRSSIIRFHQLVSVHPETTNSWIELSAVSDQQSANTLFLMSFAESRKLMADSANPKTLVSG
jgi:hypothetical protein